MSIGPDEIRAIGLSDSYQGFKRFDVAHLTAIYSPEVNFALASTNLALLIRREKYRLPDGVRRLKPFLLRNEFKRWRVLFNSKKVRLASDFDASVLGGRVPVVVQPTTYFDSLCSN